ncbi:hypothetical protein SLOPH_997 [Spraguea lophii 42_110]|uniref:Uncharacterized protein n=1 Tax=Spraguea lophii (strain 42_110) TaxID=1358809 RepID=S7W7L1_SPRLO|nr:hypothetical protein SLOPH_997 [Spraguea lophii 42_110]
MILIGKGVYNNIFCQIFIEENFTLKNNLIINSDNYTTELYSIINKVINLNEKMCITVVLINLKENNDDCILVDMVNSFSIAVLRSGLSVNDIVVGCEGSVVLYNKKIIIYQESNITGDIECIKNKILEEALSGIS